MRESWLPVLLLPLALCGPLAQASSPQIEKSELRILFVGQDPDDPQVPFRSLATERTYELFRERTAAFEELLREHFQSVRVVHGADYEPALSEAVDVTIFDAIPPDHRPDSSAHDALPSQQIRWGNYLPRDFNRPALMISHVSARIGEDLELKLDWL